MLQKGFFLTESHNPNLPAEEWTLVFEKTTQGDFSQNFGWGKYKVEMSGGAGSGAVKLTNTGNMESVYCQNGFSGEEKIIVLPIYSGTNQTFSGTIGSGGKGCTVRRQGDLGFKVTYGDAGIGYQNGATPNNKYEYDGGAWAGGSGGGSTGLFVDGILNTVSKGGNGGGVRVNYNGYKTSNGGTGGNGGTTTGTGASGGVKVEVWNTFGTYTSGDGSDGYVRIYKSNLKPEPV